MGERLRLRLRDREEVGLDDRLPDTEPTVCELVDDGLEDSLQLKVPVGANVGVREKEGERLVLGDLEAVTERELEGRDWENEVGVELLEKVRVAVGRPVRVSERDGDGGLGEWDTLPGLRDLDPAVRVMVVSVLVRVGLWEAVSSAERVALDRVVEGVPVLVRVFDAVSLAKAVAVKVGVRVVLGDGEKEPCVAVVGEGVWLAVGGLSERVQLGVRDAVSRTEAEVKDRDTEPLAGEGVLDAVQDAEGDLDRGEKEAEAGLWLGEEVPDREGPEGLGEGVWVRVRDVLHPFEAEKDRVEPVRLPVRVTPVTLALLALMVRVGAVPDAEKEGDPLGVPELLLENDAERDSECPVWLTLSQELRVSDRDPDLEGLGVSVSTYVELAVRVSVQLATGVQVCECVRDTVVVAESETLAVMEGLLLTLWVIERQVVGVTLPDRLNENVHVALSLYDWVGLPLELRVGEREKLTVGLSVGVPVLDWLAEAVGDTETEGLGVGVSDAESDGDRVGDGENDGLRATLADQLRQFVKHLGRESMYELY